MKFKKSEVTIKKPRFGNGYLIHILDEYNLEYNWPITQDELEQIVKQSLPYLRVPKGTAVNAFNKFMEKDKIDDFLKTNLN